MALAFFREALLLGTAFVSLKGGENKLILQIKELEQRYFPFYFSRVVWERPRIYQRGPGAKADPDDIVRLAIAGAQFVGALFPWDQIENLKPQEWKKQIPKAVCHHRLWRIMTPEERATFPAGTEKKIETGVQGGAYTGQVHNLLDASGIGFFRLDRFRP